VKIAVCFQILCTIAMLTTAVSGSPALVRPQRTITINGSDTMVILNREWAAEYTKQKPSVKFEVIGGGSGLGIEALMEGKTDIAAASRPMKESEALAFERKRGVRPRELVVGLDGVAVYLHNHNPVNNLTLAQLSGILRGEIRNWKEVGGLDRRIDVYNRDRFSGTRAFVQGHVLGGASFTSLAHEVSSTALLTACVSRSQGAIGYGGVAYSQGAHIIRLAAESGEIGIWPSRENVTSGAYPLSRALYFYLDPTSVSEELQAFLDWVMSPEGQEIVTLVGYYPASSAPSFPAEGDSPKSGKVIRLTPESMERNGFEISIASEEVEGGLDPDRARVLVRFEPTGTSIRRVRSITLSIGQYADVPLVLDAEGRASFILRKPLLRTTSILLEERDRPAKGARWILPLAEFL